MRRWACWFAIALVAGSGFVCAQEKPAPATPSGIKACGELKKEIEAKLDAKGVKGSTLEIVAAGDIKDQKVVGSCEGGTKKITYTREQSSAPAAKK